MEMDFLVTICLGHSDGGDVVVSVDVTEEEYKLLVACCRDGDEIDVYDGLDNLYDRIVEAAKDESAVCDPDEEEIDYDDAYYRVDFPEQVYEEAENYDDEVMDD